MTETASFTPPKKKPSIFWWLGGACLLLLVVFCFLLFGPNPPITVSRQTTFVTEPLRADGLPDYRAYLLDRYRAGVTPENNAAVLMWQAMGPDTNVDTIAPDDWKLLTAELKLPAVDPAKYITPLYGEQNRDAILRWATANAPGWKVTPRVDPEALSEVGMTPQELDAYEFISSAMAAPWRAEQLPPLAEWITANQVQFDLLVEASTRSRFYSPPIEMLRQSDDKWTLLSVSMHSIFTVREIARMLLVRAMLHLGEGQPELAWQDLLAIHRWARLIGQGTTLIEQLVAMAVEGMACAGTATLLGNERLSPQLARQIQTDLAALGPVTRLAETFDTGERIFGLSAIFDGKRAGFGTLLMDWNSLDEGPKSHPLDFVSLDWNAPLIACNQIYDRLAAASRIADFQARTKALQSIARDLQQMDAEFNSPAAWAWSTVSPARRSGLLAGAVVSFLAPAIQAAFDADDRTRVQTDLIQIAAALAVYRAEKGDFPASLDVLVPDFLPQPPVDFMNARPFVYKPSGDGYLLYSLGKNGTDDGGSNEQMSILAGEPLYDFPQEEQEATLAKIPGGADDYSIRVPTPSFKLPAPPPAAAP